jgi:hypothetical protein
MAEITSLRIKYGSKELELSFDEAKELLECLKTALGGNLLWVWPSLPSYPSQPYWQPHFYTTPEVTCSAKAEVPQE